MTTKPAAATTIIWMFFLAFSSCKRGPDYVKPNVPVPESYRASESVDESSSIADISWWALFKDPVLQDLIRISIEENKDLRRAITRIEAARGSLRSRRGGLYPTLDLDAGAEIARDSGETNTDPETESEFHVLGLLNWEIDAWGRIRRLNEAAQAQFLAAEENRRAVIVSLVSDVARAYFELRDLDNRLKIAKRTKESREESLRIARLRFEGGLTSKLVVKQAEVQLADAMLVVPEVRREIAYRENEISALLGRNPGDIRRGLTISEQPVPPSIPVGLPSALIARRPDIRRTENNLINTNALVGAAEADFFPKISLTGVFGFESRSLTRIVRGGTFSLLGDALIPLLNVEDLKGNLEIAQADYDQALISYEQAIQRAFHEVSDAIANYNAVKEIYAAQDMRLDAAKEYMRLARLQYLNGIRTYLDVLDAERELFDAELKFSQAEGGRLTTMVDLYRVLGGGWSEAEIPSSQDESEPPPAPPSDWSPR